MAKYIKDEAICSPKIYTRFKKKKKKKKKKPGGRKNREARPTALQPISVITRRVVAGHDCMCQECWDVQFATICCLHVSSSAVIQRTSRVFSMGKALNKSLLSLPSLKSSCRRMLHSLIYQTCAGEAALVCLYTCAVGDTLDQLRLLRFHQLVATSTRFVQPENLPPTSSDAKYHSLRVYLQGQIWKGESRLGPHLHPPNLAGRQ